MNATIYESPCVTISFSPSFKLDALDQVSCFDFRKGKVDTQMTAYVVHIPKLLLGRIFLLLVAHFVLYLVCDLFLEPDIYKLEERSEALRL